MHSTDDFFIWTEAFNCTEILPPFLQSFLKHHSLTIHVFAARNELASIPKNERIIPTSIEDNFLSHVFCTSELKILRGYSKGHLGTARLWADLIRTRKEPFLIHVDADTIFLDDCLSTLIQALTNGSKIVGTRRPYLHRGYRKEGRDAKRLDKHVDAINTDMFGISREDVKARFSPFLTRRIQGKRPLLYPVVDFFDPITFEFAYSGREITYLDSPDEGNFSTPNLSSPIYANRISFAAVGSGVNFWRNPKVQTSPGYRSYAISSFALYAKYLLDLDIGVEPLNNPEIEMKLRRLNRKTWRLEDHDVL